MSVQPIGEILRQLDRCRWCQKVAVLADSGGELLCLDCRAHVALLTILSCVTDDEGDQS